MYQHVVQTKCSVVYTYTFLFSTCGHFLFEAIARLKNRNKEGGND